MRWSGRVGGDRLLSVLVLAGAAVAGAPAGAQGLDFGDGSPRPGEGVAALALAERLEAEASSLEAGSAGRVLREVAARLLREGEGAGRAGDSAVLAGLTIASKREPLDGVLRRAGAPAEAYAAEALRAGPVALEPRAIDLLLRDALAPVLSPEAGPCGWWEPPNAPDPTATIAGHAEALGSLRERTELSDEARRAVGELLALARRAEAEPAYARSAAAWVRLVADAGAVLEGMPLWLEVPARDRLRESLSEGLSLVLDEPDRARAELQRVAVLARVIEATAALEARHQSRGLREAVGRLVGAGEGDPRRTPDATERIARAYLRALSLLERRPAAHGELVRAVRPMTDALARAHREAGEAMVRVLPGLLDDPDPAADPGAVAALLALERAAADLDLPRALTDALTSWTSDPANPTPGFPSPEPRPTRDLEVMAKRVQGLAVEVGRDGPGAASGAIEALRDLAAWSERAFGSAGESALRGGSEPELWRRVVGDHRERLAFVIDMAREDWVRTCAGDRGPVNEARLRAAVEAVGVIHDAVGVEAMSRAFARGGEPLINAWPGVELTAPGLAAVSEGLRERVSSLASRAARDDDAQAVVAEARDIRRHFAAALLLSGLEREASALGVGACGPAAELGMGPPSPSAWMGEHRAALAGLCRAAFEAGAAEGEARARFVAHANRLAERVEPGR